MCYVIEPYDVRAVPSKECDRSLGSSVRRSSSFSLEFGIIVAADYTFVWPPRPVAMCSACGLLLLINAGELIEARIF